MTKVFRHHAAQQTIESGVFKRLWIISGGQTGVDRAAMDFALKYRLPVRGWCPQGRLAEDGQIPASIPVQESDDADPALRTELNAYDSDGTLVLTFAEVKDGTVLTEECAEAFNRPLLTFLINDNPESGDVIRFREWIDAHGIRLLNIAGPRESFRPGVVYAQSLRWIERLLLGEQ